VGGTIPRGKQAISMFKGMPVVRRNRNCRSGLGRAKGQSCSKDGFGWSLCENPGSQATGRKSFLISPV
jgi:hypothetical protein